MWKVWSGQQVLLLLLLLWTDAEIVFHCDDVTLKSSVSLLDVLNLDFKYLILLNFYVCVSVLKFVSEKIVMSINIFMVNCPFSKSQLL